MSSSFDLIRLVIFSLYRSIASLIASCTMASISALCKLMDDSSMNEAVLFVASIGVDVINSSVFCFFSVGFDNRLSEGVFFPLLMFALFMFVNTKNNSNVV